MVYLVHDRPDPGGEREGVDPDLRPALIVLPGGDGSREFERWVGTIASRTPEGWLTVQLVAPRWRDDANRIVWPTEGLPDDRAEFTTDAFIDAVAREIQADDRVDPERTYVLGWSSGGPPAYAAVMTPDIPVSGAIVLMSVFKPDLLPDPAGSAGRHVCILHARDDFIPMRFADLANDTLAPHAAGVRLDRYAGGHGWTADLLDRTAAAFDWIDADHATEPPDTPPP